MPQTKESIFHFPLEFPLVLAPGSAHARPSTQPPIKTSGNFKAHLSANSLSNISPNCSEVITKFSEPLDNFGKYPPLSGQI